MRSPYNNRHLLIRDFQGFLARKHLVPGKRVPYRLRSESRFHEFYGLSNIDDNAPGSIAAYVQDLAKP